MTTPLDANALRALAREARAAVEKAHAATPRGPEDPVLLTYVERIANGEDEPRGETTCAGSGKAYEMILTSYPPQYPCPVCRWTTFTPNPDGTIPPHAPKGGGT